MRKKTLKKVAKVVPQETKDYKITLKVNGKEYVCNANNLEECIVANRPEFIKTRLVIVVEKNGMKFERFLLGFRARQFFRNALFPRLFLKNLLK